MCQLSLKQDVLDFSSKDMLCLDLIKYLARQSWKNISSTAWQTSSANQISTYTEPGSDLTIMIIMVTGQDALAFSFLFIFCI